MNRCLVCPYYRECEYADKVNFCEDCKEYFSCTLPPICCKVGYDIECNNGFEKDCIEQVYYSKQDAIDCINCMPSADVVEVVRCGDCKHYTDNINDDNLRNGFCNRLKNYYFDTHKPTDFCSFGKRRDDKQ